MLLTLFGIVLISNIGGALAECKVDIVFLVDTSSSIGTSNFQKVKDFIAKSVNHFTIGPSATRVSVVTFSTNVHDVFYLSRYSDKPSLLHAISRLPYEGKQTYTGKALQHVRQVSFTAAHGDRRDARNVLVIITDGVPSDRTLTEAETKLLAHAFPDLVDITFSMKVTISLLGHTYLAGGHTIDFPLKSSTTTVLGSVALLNTYENKVHSTACDVCLSNPCQHQGTCTSLHNSFKCHCKGGYIGALCEKVDFCHSNPCRNGGRCENHYQTHHSSYICHCVGEFIGHQCEIVNHCHFNPCVHGKCRNYSHRWSCICNAGFGGTTCNQEITTTPPTTTTTTIPMPHIIPVDECTDKLTNCEEYGMTVCYRYKEWASINCAESCHVCNETTTNTNFVPLQPIILG